MINDDLIRVILYELANYEFRVWLQIKLNQTAGLLARGKEDE
jgi:hypothetical protein